MPSWFIFGCGTFIRINTWLGWAWRFREKTLALWDIFTLLVHSPQKNMLGRLNLLLGWYPLTCIGFVSKLYYIIVCFAMVWLMRHHFYKYSSCHVVVCNPICQILIWNITKFVIWYGHHRGHPHLIPVTSHVFPNWDVGTLVLLLAWQRAALSHWWQAFYNHEFTNRCLYVSAWRPLRGDGLHTDKSIGVDVKPGVFFQVKSVCNRNALKFTSCWEIHSNKVLHFCFNINLNHRSFFGLF